MPDLGTLNTHQHSRQPGCQNLVRKSKKKKVRSWNMAIYNAERNITWTASVCSVRNGQSFMILRGHGRRSESSSGLSNSNKDDVIITK